MSNLKLIAIKKNEKYFVRHKTEKYYTFSNLVFNSKQLPSFSENWAVFEQLPTKCQKKYEVYQKTTGYSLKQEFTPTIATPQKVELSFFEYIGDESECKNNNIRGLYQSDYETVPERLEDVQFTIEIIDEDCEPLIKPKYPFVTDFPYFIENHETVKHKYPCHINAQDLFNIIKSFIKNNIPEHCKITSDYDFHFCVELIAPLIHEETYQKRVSKFGAKKEKYETAPLRSIPFKIIDIGTPQRDGKYGNEIIKDLKADNYQDLEELIDTILEGYKEVMKLKLTVCPHCKGYGFKEAT